MKHYSVTRKTAWMGRVDSAEDFDSFRWHQWVKAIDLNDAELEPLEKGLGFAFLGFECDRGIQINMGRSGAANGPDSIRKELSNLPCQFDKQVLLFDAGNISCLNCTLEEAQDALAVAVEKILDLNLFPILLGGGHEIAYGHYKGILNYLESQGKADKIGIVNFDAHFDLRPYENGSSSGTMFRQIADLAASHNTDYSYMCIGLQKHGNTLSLFKTADELGVKYIYAKDVATADYAQALEKLDDYLKDRKHIYVTICADVFSSAYAPGVSAPQPLGLTPKRVLVFLKHILKSGKTVSFDIAEVSPRFDQDNVTSNLAATMIFSVVNTISKEFLRKDE